MCFDHLTAIAITKLVTVERVAKAVFGSAESETLSRR